MGSSGGSSEHFLRQLLQRLFSKVMLRLRLFPATGARGARYRTGDDGTGSPWSGALTSIPEEQSSSSPEMADSPMLGELDLQSTPHGSAAPLLAEGGRIPI